MAQRINKKRWLMLGAVATALLLIPRRSSQRADSSLQNDTKNKTNNNSNAKD
ncbi:MULTISPECIES: hypothetical protein [Psychrobacter]|jgi:hypothetical protein|uniref:hypothetical protein n=1 Tax=Psychrobacter TaxID=497 RepID=UPI00191A3AC0|nr:MULTISPECIES: hypothetical protein [Psychrobacter]